MIYKYANPEFFADWEKPDLRKYSGNLILYGAGRRGVVAAYCLKKLGVEFVCFCDSDVKKHGMQVSGHRVISPEELKEKYPDSPVLITTNHYYYLKELLDSWGYKDVFSCVSLFLEIDFAGFDEDFSVEYMCRNTDQYFNSLHSYSGMSREYLADLMFNVTNRCTLRCRECSTYIPYVTHPIDFDSTVMIESLDKLLIAYKVIGNISLYGGEPLLYKDLPKLVREFTARPQVKKVTVITNGTLLPTDKLLEELINAKVRVRISDYGSLSTKRDELIKILREHNVFTEVTNFQHWDLTPTVDILNETDEQLKEKVRNCCTIAKMPLCINGKMFFCGFSGYYDYFEAVPDFGDNYVDLLNFSGSGGELRDEINLKFQMATDGLPKKVCRYCKFDHMAQHLPVAEQTMETLKFKKVY